MRPPPECGKTRRKKEPQNGQREAQSCEQIPWGKRRGGGRGGPSLQPHPHRVPLTWIAPMWSRRGGQRGVMTWQTGGERRW